MLNKVVLEPISRLLSAAIGCKARGSAFSAKRVLDVLQHASEPFSPRALTTNFSLDLASKSVLKWVLRWLSCAVIIVTSNVSAENAIMPRTLLLVDDQHVLYRAGTERFLHPGKRYHANPVLKETKPWEVAIAWTSVHYDPEAASYQLWYQAYGGHGTPQPQCVTCYAESKDGIHWSKPELDLFPWNDIKKTNIIMVGNGGRSLRYGNTVIVDPRDSNPDRRYKMAYFDFSKATQGNKSLPGLFVAFSPDGIHWTKPDIAMPIQNTAYGDYGDTVPFNSEAGRELLVPLSISDCHDVFYDAKRKVFVDYAKMWIDGPDGGMFWKHGVGRSESKDFIHWSQPTLVLTPDEFDAAYVEFHTAPVFLYADTYFALAQVLDRAKGGGVIDIELMLSWDGFNWRRPFRNSFFFARAGGKQFEGGSIFTNATPIMLKDEIRFYYGAYSQGATGADDTKPMSGIGLFTIPRDRFAGLRPVALSNQPTLRKALHHIGQVTMKPISLPDYGAITLNADASKGEIRVELLDAKGYRIKGYTKEDAEVITGDSLRHSLSWKERTLADLPPGEYMLRIHMKKASLFALNLIPK